MTSIRRVCLRCVRKRERWDRYSESEMAMEQLLTSRSRAMTDPARWEDDEYEDEEEEHDTIANPPTSSPKRAKIPDPIPY